MKKLILILLVIASSASAGMLNGQTPSTFNINDYPGWETVRTQDFEGSEPTGEDWSDSATTERPHSGSKSMAGTYSADSDAVQWALNEGQTGSWAEIYISFWEYTESQARFNDEYLLAHINDPVYGDTLNINFLWGTTYNSTRAYFQVTAEGLANDQGPGQSPWGLGTVTVPTGAWNQWEIHVRQGTPGQPDGFFKIYRNGEVWMERTNAMIIGPGRSFNNGRILAGGYYTKIVWMNDYPTCSIPSGCLSWEDRINFAGNDLCVEHMGWWGQSFSSPRCAPADPPLPDFKRFIDDVIVLKTSGSTEGDISPPYTNSNTPAKNSTGWPVNNRTVSFYVRDPSGVTRSSIGLTINGGAVMRCGVELVCSP